MEDKYLTQEEIRKDEYYKQMMKQVKEAFMAPSEKALAELGIELSDEARDFLENHPLMGAAVEIDPDQEELIRIVPIKKVGRQAEEIANKLVPKILDHVSKVESIISCIDGDPSDLPDTMLEGLEEIHKLWDTVESFMESNKEK